MHIESLTLRAIPRDGRTVSANSRFAFAAERSPSSAPSVLFMTNLVIALVPGSAGFPERWGCGAMAGSFGNVHT